MSNAIQSDATQSDSGQSDAQPAAAVASDPIQDYRDSHIRSLAKAFSWRIVATLTTSVIAYLVTGRLDTAALIGGIEFFVKFLIYYFHERAWQMVPMRRRR